METTRRACRLRVLGLTALGLLAAAAPPAGAAWTSAAPFPHAAYEQTATLLGDGRVLVAGGTGQTSDGFVTYAVAELYDPVSNRWSQAASMATARRGATATALGSGKVLVVGGQNADFDLLASAELYDPATNTWSSAGSMATPRTAATATLLGNGEVLVAGGGDDSGIALSGALRSAELYDPASNTWAPAPDMSVPRAGAAAVALSDGRALVVGGADDDGSIATAEIYDPGTGAWSSAGRLTTGRYDHAATLLADGRVLVSGGESGSSDSSYARKLASAELYDPAAGTWSATSRMAAARGEPRATLLFDGRVLVTGGDKAATELYDPATGSWSSAGRMKSSTEEGTATRLADGRVLAGGWPLRTAELYTPGPNGAPASSRPVFPAQPVLPGGPTGGLAPVVPTAPGPDAGAVVLAPPGRAGACAPNCMRTGVHGEPAFTPDGRTVYMQGRSGRFDAVFARNPRTGALSGLPCTTSSGGTRCPPANMAVAVSPDGRWLYALNGQAALAESELYVFARAADGALTPVRCLGDTLNADPGCDPSLPTGLTGMRMSPDFASLYLLGARGLLMKLDRDQATGVLSIADCVAAAAVDGCRSDASLDGLGQATFAGRDVYVYTRRPDGYDNAHSARVVDYRPDASTGRLVKGGVTRGRVIEDLVPSPDGRRLYGVAAGDTALLTFPRNAETGKLGAPTCTVTPAARSRCLGVGDSGPSSLAVSPDGRTVVTTGYSYTGCNHCGLPVRLLVTYRETARGRMRVVGCVGDAVGCGGSAGTGLAVRYPPSGAGPYHVSSRGLRLLAPAPTINLGRLSLGGANRASVRCPRGRTSPCRGQVVVRLLRTWNGEDGGYRTFTTLERLTYRAAPGGSRRISLRLDSRARRRLVALAAGSERLHGPPSGIALAIRLSDAAGLASTTGAGGCLVPPVRHLDCSGAS